MSIAMTCAGCTHQFSAPPQAAGMKVACPRCKVPIRVPGQPPGLPVAGPPPAPAVEPKPVTVTLPAGPLRVVVVDVHLPFWSIIELIVGFSLAMIPAGLVLGALGVGFWLAVAWLLGFGPWAPPPPARPFGQ